MTDFKPGKKMTAYSRPSMSQRHNRPKERMTRCHTSEGIRPCRKCCLPTANLGRYCTGCLNLLMPLRLYVPPTKATEVTDAADTPQQS